MTIEQPPSDPGFAVGEIAIFVKPGPNHGREVTIVGPLRLVRALNTLTNEVVQDWRYQIDAPDIVLGPFLSTDPRIWAEPRFLRKKRPPRGDLQIVRWDQCPWQPESVNV